MKNKIIGLLALLLTQPMIAVPPTQQLQRPRSRAFSIQPQSREFQPQEQQGSEYNTTPETELDYRARVAKNFREFLQYAGLLRADAAAQQAEGLRGQYHNVGKIELIRKIDTLTKQLRDENDPDFSNQIEQLQFLNNKLIQEPDADLATIQDAISSIENQIKQIEKTKFLEGTIVVEDAPKRSSSRKPSIEPFFEVEEAPSPQDSQKIEAITKKIDELMEQLPKGDMRIHQLHFLKNVLKPNNIETIQLALDKIIHEIRPSSSQPDTPDTRPKEVQDPEYVQEIPTVERTFNFTNKLGHGIYYQVKDTNNKDLTDLIMVKPNKPFSFKVNAFTEFPVTLFIYHWNVKEKPLITFKVDEDKEDRDLMLQYNEKAVSPEQHIKIYWSTASPTPPRKKS